MYYIHTLQILSNCHRSRRLIAVHVQNPLDYSLSDGPSALCDRKINPQFSVKFEVERKQKSVSVQLGN